MTQVIGAQPAPSLQPGFADPVFDGQKAFRAILDATAYAGRPQDVGVDVDAPAPLAGATVAVCLSLLDFETPLWLDPKADGEAVAAYLRFHCGAPIVAESRAAQFAVIADPASMPDLAAFNPGEDRYPDRSATLIIQVPSLTQGPRTRWSGPGIDGAIEPGIAGLPAWFWHAWRGNRELYPTGVDVLFCAGRSVVGLPRGIMVEG